MEHQSGMAAAPAGVGQASGPPFVRRVRLRNYKGIAHCDVELGALTLIVGRNGAGKSHFLDALGFVAQALDATLDQAFRSRGGFKRVRHRPARDSDGLAVCLEFDMGSGIGSSYGFGINAHGDGAVGVESELLKHRPKKYTYRIERSGSNPYAAEIDFDGPQGKFLALPPVSSDRLLLPVAVSIPELRAVLNA